jgi:hypothetical protein
MNLTANWDGTVDSFKWSAFDGKKNLFYSYCRWNQTSILLNFLDSHVSLSINNKSQTVILMADRPLVGASMIVTRGDIDQYC